MVDFGLAFQSGVVRWVEDRLCCIDSFVAVWKLCME